MLSCAVIIPVHNRNELLLRAMRSLPAQEMRPQEVVIVDDASESDLSESEAFARSNGFRWLRLPRNSGVAAARNAGVKETESEWICFLDSDDEWLPGKVKSQVAWHLKHPESRISQVHESWLRKGEAVRKPAHWQQHGGDLFAEAVERCAISPSCVMLSRSLWGETGGFDEEFRVCEDYELWLRITAGESIGLTGDEPLVRKHAGHEGQLSVETPAMDRFRVHALIKLLLQTRLEAWQRDIVAAGIRKKAAILEQGAAKRGGMEREAFYGAVSVVSWESLPIAEMEAWLVRSRGFLEG